MTDRPGRHALIISGTMSRFSRARSQVLSSRGFAEATWLPGIFGQGNAPDCTGPPMLENLLLAHQNAWRLIASAGVAMGVFEDDATYLGTEPQIDARGTMLSPILRLEHIILLQSTLFLCRHTRLHDHEDLDAQ